MLSQAGKIISSGEFCEKLCAPKAFYIMSYLLTYILHFLLSFLCILLLLLVLLVLLLPKKGGIEIKVQVSKSTKRYMHTNTAVLFLTPCIAGQN